MDLNERETETTERKPTPWRRIGVGVLVGAALGYAYFAFIGCSTGGCPITSNPISSVLYGSVIGGLITSM